LKEKETNQRRKELHRVKAAERDSMGIAQSGVPL